MKCWLCENIIKPMDGTDGSYFCDYFCNYCNEVEKKFHCTYFVYVTESYLKYTEININQFNYTLQFKMTFNSINNVLTNCPEKDLKVELQKIKSKDDLIR